MEAYPGASLTTEQILDALSRRVEQQRSVRDQNRDFWFMVSNQEKILSKLLYELRQMCSSMNVASSAPAEVITTIAMEGLLLDPERRHDLISMSHVCRSWREAVISYPLLWNTITNNSELVTRMCLERSKSLPLTVSHSEFSGWSYSTKRLLGSHASRFETLSLDGVLPCGLYEILTNLRPAEDPILRELSLWSTEELNATSFEEYKSLPLPLLSKDIPTLHKIFLSSFPLTPQLIALRHLTNIELVQLDPAPIGDVLDLLANNPCLEHVTIIRSFDDTGSDRGDLSITLPRLRNLALDRCDSIDILRCLHIPRSQDLEIELQHSFKDVVLPGPYQPYSTIQMAWDLGFHTLCLHSNPKFHLKLRTYSRLEEVTAEFGELPPGATEVLGPSTVQFIKHLHFWPGQAHSNWHPPGISDALNHMERLETLTLDCSPALLAEIFFILIDVSCCPLLRTLIVRFPEGVAADAEEDSLLDVVRSRAGGGNAIWRLRVIVSSEEHVPTYSQIFTPLLQEVEILACEPGAKNGRPLLVWED